MGAAGAPVPIEDEPGEQVHEEDVETEVAIEVAAYPLPFEPEEAGDHGVLQQVAMLLKVVVIEIKKEPKIRWIKMLNLRKNMVYGTLCRSE